MTPSDIEYKNSEPGFGDDTPYSSRVYATQNGGVGKYSEIEAPGDLTRPYYTTLDATRGKYLAKPLDYANNPVTFGATAGGSTVAAATVWGPWAMIDSVTLGTLLAVTTGGGTDAGNWCYRWDVASKRFLPYVRLVGVPAQSFDTNLQSRAVNDTFRPTIRHEGGPVWLSVGASFGMTDITTSYPQTQVQNGITFWNAVQLGDILFTFQNAAAGGLQITARNKTTLAAYTPASLSGVAAPELGNAVITVNVPSCMALHTPVVYNGAIYFCSDRAVYKMVYDDNNAKILVVPIRTKFTRITGNPEIFLGSLYVPSGNTVWKWTPGQQEFTPLPVDPGGTIPRTLGGGVICALTVTSRELVAVAQSAPNQPTDYTVLRMNSDSVWQVVRQTQGARLGGFGGVAPLVTVYDGNGTNFSAGTLVLTPSTTPAQYTAVPFYESNYDPSFLPAVERHQTAGSGFWISPWDPGQAYGTRKDLLKLVGDVADVDATHPIRVYYQTNYEDRATDSLDEASGGFATASIPTTEMAGQGAWHLAQTFNNATAGLSLIGGGYQGYAEKSMLSLALQDRRIRWCVEVVGDATGTLYPRLYGMRFVYSETPAKYVLWNLRVRIMVEDPDLSGSVGAYATPADVYAAWNTLWGYAKAGTFVPFQDMNGDTRLVKITKFRYDLADLADTPDGLPVLGRRRARKIVLNLALQEGDSAA